MSALSAPAAAEVSVVVPCYNEARNVAELVRRLAAALGDTRWEIVFVDDDSPDGTSDIVRAIAAHDARVRCIRRIGRRGLASAVIEGVLSCSSPIVAVMDGDLQHDETRLSALVDAVRTGAAEVAIASRFAQGGDAQGLSAPWRHGLSGLGIRAARAMLPEPVSDPLSGFFALRRTRFEEAAPRLTGEGFKILLDLLLTADPPLRVLEVGAGLRAREAGESKLSPLVLLQFVALLIDKRLHGAVPLRFMSFAAVGTIGVFVQLAAFALFAHLGLAFVRAETAATLAAMMTNFWLNNALTYRDRRLTGTRAWTGLLLFMLVCSAGAVANVGIAQLLHADAAVRVTAASAAGAIVGAVWNYAMSATVVWNRRPRRRPVLS